LRFSFIFLHKGLITFFVFSPHFQIFNTKYMTSFGLTLICIFGRLLKPSSLECLKAPLVHQQASLPISKGGVGFVFVEVITPTTHLGNKGLVAPIITSNFLLDGCPFLLRAIRANTSGPLPFEL
jgi:hypothetical protein